MSAKQMEPKVLTADKILKALESGATSLTAVAKLIGYKSGSSSVIKKIRATVPDIQDRTAINVPAKDAPIKDTASEEKSKAVKGKKARAGKKTADKNPVNKEEYPMPDCVPYRPSSGYAKIYAVLFAFKDKGISKSDLVAKYMAWSGKPAKNAHFDTQVVCSPREDSSCNRSAGKASQTYYVERQNDWYRLHIIGENK
jgi:hypothetical protein